MSDATSRCPAFPMERDARCPFDPPPELKLLQEEAPVTKVQIWNGSTAWLITRYADVRMVLRDPRFSANPATPGYPPMSAGHLARRTELWPDVFAMDNPEHNQYRMIQNADFRINRVEALRPRVQAMVDESIDAILAGPKPVDLYQAFCLPLPSLVICELLGVPYEDHHLFQDNSRVLASTNSTMEESKAALASLRSYMEGLVERKLAAPTDDFVSRIAVEQVQTGKLTATNVANMAVNLLSAGHNTTANTIALSIALLLQHPDQLAELRVGDAKLVAGAVEELLRYLSVTHLGRRRAVLEDVEIGGQLIKAGEGLIVGNMIADRDEDVYDSPDKFDIHRDARHHLAFGYGYHQCLGQPLARLEMQVALGTIVRRIPSLRLAVPPEELRYNYEALLWGVHELPVTW